MASYNKGSYTTQRHRRLITVVYDIKWKSDRSFQVTGTETSQTSAIRQELYKQFTALQSEGKPMTGPTIIEKAKSFYDKTKITDMCTFSEDWMQTLVTV